jgi:magnesium-transporting ATPase (P-type)
MITGDHKDTAVAIGHQLGIVDEKYSEAVTGPEMDAMSDDELRMAVMTHNVFARASPQNKIRIVKALQAEGQVASMTGDGVNDAPALKAADMGVAMGKEGTDVAREASQMILADDNFATIVVAVREGRVVWDNLRKVLLVNTPINNAQGLSVLFGLACGLQDSPLTAIQVLYSNLICAVTLGFVCAVEPAEDGIMAIPPRRVGKRLIGRYLFLRICLGTAFLTAAVVGASFISLDLGYSAAAQRASAFNTLNFGAISITCSARFTYNSSIHPRLFRGNNILIYSIIIVIVLQVFTTYTPGLNSVIFSMEGMNGTQWAVVIGFAVIVFLVMEAEKGLRRYFRAQGKDTGDAEVSAFDAKVKPAPPAGFRLLPKGASKLGVFQ